MYEITKKILYNTYVKKYLEDATSIQPLFYTTFFTTYLITIKLLKKFRIKCPWCLKRLREVATSVCLEFRYVYFILFVLKLML